MTNARERPSAETVLHTRLYRRDAGIGCVLHTHSLVQTVASRVFAPRGGVRLEGYELAKAIADAWLRSSFDPAGPSAANVAAVDKLDAGKSAR